MDPSAILSSNRDGAELLVKDNTECEGNMSKLEWSLRPSIDLLFNAQHHLQEL